MLLRCCLDVETNGTIKDPWGNTRAGLVLEGKVNRFDYGIKYNSVLEAGGVAVGEKVKLIVELEGILKKIRIYHVPFTIYFTWST